MKGYTYQDYLEYKQLKNKKLQLMEDGVEYELNIKKHTRDKIFKEILDNKKEAIKLINYCLQLDRNKFKEEDIEKYNRKFILPELENRESDIIYKLKGKSIFFLIEHQSKVDYSMPVRILEYSMEIIRSATSKEKMKNKKEVIANVYQIVLYTGKVKWTAARSIEQRQERVEGSPNMLSNRYYLLDINDYTKEQLMKADSILSKAMLLEKLYKPEEIFKAIKEITSRNLDADDRYFLELIIIYLLPKKIGVEKAKEILQELNKEGEDSMFLDILADYFDEKEAQAVKRGTERGMKQGMKQGIKQGMKRGMEQGMECGIKETTNKFITEMLKNKVDENFIKKITKIGDKELEQIKKEFENKKI